MVDIEKVIKGLERCKLYNKVNCDKCPYDYNGRGNGKSECTAELATDALELLMKDQEVVVPLTIDDAVSEIMDKHYKWLKEQEKKAGKWIPVTNGRGGMECSICHDYAPSYQNGTEYLSTYCPNCGSKMEGR